MRRPHCSIWCLLTAMVWTAAACSDSPTSNRPGVAAQLDIVGGDAQSGTVGTELTAPLVVKALDAEGRAVPNQLVNFRVTAGGGSVFAGSALTNTQGIAQERWTLGTSTQGQQQVEARAVSSATGAALVVGTFNATALPGPAASIEIAAGNDQGALAGSPLGVAPSVRVRDQHGNVVPGTPVRFTVATGGGTVAHETQITDASGVATAGTWTLGLTEGIQTLTASSGQASGATISALARSRTPAQLTVLAGNNQSGVVGTAVATPPVILVRNASGDALPGVSVAFAPAPGGGVVTGATVTTDALGRAAVGSWTLGTTPGSQTLSASAAMVSVDITATATTGALVALVVIDALPAIAEVASVSTFGVRAVDQFGNPVAGAEVSFDVTAGGGSVAPGIAMTRADGSAAATWTLGTAVGENAVRARAGSGVAVSVGIGARPGAPARLVKRAGDGQTATVGTAVAARPSLVVEDRFGNAVPHATVAFQVGAGGGSGGGSVVSGTDGVATVAMWVLGTTPTSNTLQASTPGTSAIVFTATAVPGPAASVTKTAGDAQGATVGTQVAIRPTVAVGDSYGNPVAGTAVVFTVTGGGGTVTGATTTTGSDGTASVGAWQVGDMAGPQSLTASVEGLPPVVFTGQAKDRVAAQIVPHGSNVSAAVYRDRLAPSVIVVDEFGGPVPGVPVTFSAATFGDQTTGADAITNSDGIATVASWTVLSCSGQSVLRATAVGVAQPRDITVAVASDGPTRLSAGYGVSSTLNFSVDVGNLGAPEVSVFDSCNRPVPGVTVTFTPDSLSRLDGDITSAVSDVSGVARSTTWRPRTRPGVTHLTTSVQRVNGQIITAVYEATIYHGAPQRLVKVAGDEQSGPAGSTLPIAPSVRVEDQFGNAAPQFISSGGPESGRPVGPVTVTFTGLDGGAGVATFPVNADGTVTASPWTLGLMAGVQSVSAATNSHSTVPVIKTAFTANATAPRPNP